MWVTSKPKSPTHPIQARPELPRDQSHWLPNSCPARSYWSSRRPREPERNTRHQRSGSATATSKIRKETWLASDQPRPTNRHDTHLKLIWKRFEWKQVKQTRPGHITNNQTEVKQATSAQRKYNHTCDTPSWTCYKFLEEVQSVTSRACEKLIGKSAEHNIKSVWEVLWRSAERNIQIVLEVARKKCRAQHQDCVRQEDVPRTLHMTLIHHPTPSTERDRVRKSRGETEKHTKAGVVLSPPANYICPEKTSSYLWYPLV